MSHVTRILVFMLAAVALLGGVPARASEALDYQNARKLYETGLYSRAAREAQDILDEYPDGRYRPETFYLLGESEFAQGNYQDAREAFESTVREFGRPDLREEAAVRIAECALNLGLDEEAITEAQQFLNDWPKSRLAGRAWLVLGHAHRRRGEYAQALESFRKAADPSVGFSGGTDRETALFFAGRSALESDQPGVAAALFREALKPDESASGEAAPEKRYGAESLFYLTEALLRLKDYSGAVDSASQFLATYPDSPFLGGVLLRQARAEAGLGRIHEARTAYCGILGPAGASICAATETPIQATSTLKVLESDPSTRAWAFLDLARLEKEPDSAEVYRAMEDWLRTQKSGDYFNPQDFLATSLLERARLSMADGRRDEALRMLDEVIQQHPKSPAWSAAVLEGVRARFELDLYPQAQDDVARLLSAEPENALGRLWQARIQAAEGQIAEASASFALLARRVDDDGTIRPHVHYHYAAFLYEQKDYESALAQFENVIADKAATQELVLDAIRGKAESLYQLGRYTESAAAAREVLSLWGPLATVRMDKVDEWSAVNLTLGWSLFEAGDIAGASEVFQRVMDRGGDEEQGWALEARYMLGQCFLEQKEFGKAKDFFDDVVSASPSGEFALTAMYRLAWCDYREENWAKAAYEFARYLDAAKEKVLTAPDARGLDLMDDAAFHRGWSLSTAGKNKEAREAFVALAEGSPESEYAPKAWVAAGDVSYNLGDYDAAMLYYGNAARLYPRSDSAPGALISLGWSAQAAAKTDEALRAWQQAADLYPGSDIAREGLTSAAELLYRNRDYKGALAGFRQIVQTYPKSDEAVRATYWAGRSLLELKEYPAAAQVLKQFAGEYPDSSVALDSLFWCAQAYERGGQDATATVVYGDLVDRIGDIESATGTAAILAAEGLLAQGHCLERLGRIEEASDAFKKVRLVPGVLAQTRRAALKAEGDMWLKSDEPQRAIEPYRNLLADERLDETEAAAQYGIGVALESMGNYEGAVEEYLRTGNLYDKHWDITGPALTRAAGCLEKLNRWEEAMRVYERILELAPVSGEDDSASIRQQAANRLAWIRDNEAILNLQLPEGSGGEVNSTP